jgi:hypothetical protein
LVIDGSSLSQSRGGYADYEDHRRDEFAEHTTPLAVF